MKKYLIIIFITLLFESVFAQNLTCKNIKNDDSIEIFYDQEKIQVQEKNFSDIFIFGNGMSGKFYIHKSIFLGIGKKLDEVWQIDLEFRDPKTAVISKSKYLKGQSKIISEDSYLCQ